MSEVKSLAEAAGIALEVAFDMIKSLVFAPMLEFWRIFYLDKTADFMAFWVVFRSKEMNMAVTLAISFDINLP